MLTFIFEVNISSSLNCIIKIGILIPTVSPATNYVEDIHMLVYVKYHVIIVEFFNHTRRIG